MEMTLMTKVTTSTGVTLTTDVTVGAGGETDS